jgi:RNA 2',3'-cyclic 3'-phosphodiesterase
MRLFIAIELPEDAKEHLLAVRDAAKPHVGGAALTRAANLHLTLKFLGEVEPRRAESLVESLEKVKGPAGIELSAVEIECFPSRGSVRIVASALGGQVEALAAVHAAIEQRCRFLGFERETRAYRPHVTLARARPALPPATRERLSLATEDLFPGPAFVAEEFVLVRSTLRPQGSEYVTIARFRFSRPD